MCVGCQSRTVMCGFLCAWSNSTGCAGVVSDCGVCDCGV